jgi:hypothetical protein
MGDHQMKLTTASAGRVAILAVACCAAALPAAALAGSVRPASAHPGRPGSDARAAAATAVPRCTSFRTTIWLGLGNGGGTLGTIFYPLEFSNTGRRSCTLFGYPRVFAVSGTGQQIGLPAIPSGRRHLIMLPPGGTAHAVLGIVEAGNLGGCQLRKGAFLKVAAPGQQAVTFIPNFTFTACANKSVLQIDAVHQGTGVPGSTTS